VRILRVAVAPILREATDKEMTVFAHWWELALILILALVFFGPKRLPEIGRSLGTGMREFKDSVTSSDSKTEDVFAIPAERESS